MAKKKMSEGLEKALKKLVDRLVERMEDASKSLEWTQGWVQSGGAFGLPRNITGSSYVGMNAFLLSLHTAENGYKMPIYMTHTQASKLGVKVLPKSKSIPVFKWGMSIRDKEGKPISEEEYRNMSEEKQKECTIYPYLKYFNEFNIDQTNYKEVYPEKYEKLLSNFVDPDRGKADTNGMYNNEALNKVIEEKDGWICPIVLDPTKGAAYNSGFNSIHIPPKANYRIHEGNAEETFKDGQEYYSTALHEMAHSTGHESVLKRDGIVKFDGFGSPSYAKEELVAELTAAMVSNTLGFDKRITENSAAYLKGWAATLRKEPKYIVSVMADVNKASRIELEYIDKQRKALGQKSLLEGTLDGLEEKENNEQQLDAIKNGEKEEKQNSDKMDKKIYYSNLNADTDIELKMDPEKLMTLYKKGDKQGLSDAIKQAQKDAVATWELNNLQETMGDKAEVILEDDKHAIVKYPEQPETFFMFEKVTEEQILHKISQYGLSEDDSDIAKKIGNEAVKKQFDGMRSHTLEMPNGTVLGVDYDPSTNEMLAGGITNAGLAPDHRSDYDHSITLNENLQNFSEELMSMDEYQAQEEDIEEEVSEDQEEELSEDNSVQKEETESPEVSESQEETQEEVEDVDKKELAAKEWSTIDNKLEMPSGDTLTVDYNKEKDTLDVLITTPDGKQEVYSTGYDHDHEAKANLGFAWEELSNMKQYQAKQEEKESDAQSIDPKDEKKYYSSFAFMQSWEEIEQFRQLNLDGKYDEMLNLASEYDQEQEIELDCVENSATIYSGDDLLAENDNYAVVFNSSNGDSYNLQKKYSENELREEIERLGGIGANPSDAIKEIAHNMTADEFAAIKKEPVFEMPNGEALHYQYNKETDKIEVGTATNNGLAVVETFMFERDKSVEANLESVYDEMSQREEYRAQEPEEDEIQKEDETQKEENKPILEIDGLKFIKEDSLSDEPFYAIETEMVPDTDGRKRSICLQFTPFSNGEYNQFMAYYSYEDTLRTDHEYKLLSEEGKAAAIAYMDSKLQEQWKTDNWEHFVGPGNSLTDKKYLSVEMNRFTDGKHEGHAILNIKNISELRDYYKDDPHVNEWLKGASDREIIEAGADKLPNLRYSHKEGRTLYDMGKAYHNIIFQYGDVKTERTRLQFSIGIENKKEKIDLLDHRIKQIAHRAEQAQAIMSNYQDNIDKVYGSIVYEDAHKIIPRAEYAASISQGQTATLDRPIDESYCYSFRRFKSSLRTKVFDNFRENGNNEALLHLAKDMDVIDPIELNKVRKNAPKTSDDKVLAENAFYAVTYNEQNRTFDLLRKIDKEQVLKLIGGIHDNEEIKASSIDVQKLAYEDAAQQVAEFAEHAPRFLTMPNKEVLDYQYNEGSNQIEVGKMSSEGMDVLYTFDYDLSASPEHNLSIVHDDLAGLDEYRLLSDEEVEQREKTALSWRITDNKLELPSGDVLTVEYDQKKDTLNVAYTTEDGKPEIFSTKYRHENSTTKNVGDLWEKFAGMKQYQAKQEGKTSKDGQKAEVPHEDSLSDTNVAAEAKHIAATGVPIEKAEKIAKEKFDDINHENMHKEEDKQTKAEKEKKYAEKKTQEQKKQEEAKKEDNTTKMVISHSALLIAALASAKAKDGVWMNPGYRQNAQFLFSKTPITGYNNLMMNLHAEQNGYRSNIYTQYRPANENGIPVKEGEKAFYLGWTHWSYVKGDNDREGITSKKWNSLSAEEKAQYQLRATTKTLNVWNIDQTIYPGKHYDNYINTIKQYGDKVESLTNIKSEDVESSYTEAEKKHRGKIVIMEDGDTMKAYREGAKKLSKLAELPLTKAEYHGKEVSYLEFDKSKISSVLQKVVGTGSSVIVCNKDDYPKMYKELPSSTDILTNAHTLAKSAAKVEGLEYERIMVPQDAEYQSKEKKLVVSGMSNPNMDSRTSAIAHANDLYRVLAGMTGTKDRLARGGHINLTPVDDAKYEQLVRELTAGVLMARQGLPATLTKESMNLIPYWEREIKESPRLMDIIKKDVNNAVEVIEDWSREVKPDYRKMIGVKAENRKRNKSDYTVIKKLNEYPNIESKEIVVVKDASSKTATAILPQGASLEANNEVSGMRKDRIRTALVKEGYEEVKFCNAGGNHGLKETNGYFADKEVSVVRLNQYKLESTDKVDITPLMKVEDRVKMKNFAVCKSEELGKYFFHIEAEGEKAFDIVPEKKYINSYFNTIKQGQNELEKMRNVLFIQFYKLGKEHPDMTQDLLYPHKVDVDMSRIGNVSVFKTDKKVPMISAMIDGERKSAVIPKSQFDNMFVAEDKTAFKQALAAVTFESILKPQENQNNNQGQSENQSQEKKQSMSKATPSEQSIVDKGGQKEDEEPSQRRSGGRGM